MDSDDDDARPNGRPPQSSASTDAPSNASSGRNATQTTSSSQPLNQTLQSTSMSDPASDLRRSRDMMTTQAQLYQELDDSELTLLGNRAKGLDDRSLPLWTHAFEHAREVEIHHKEFSKSIDRMLLRTGYASSLIKTSEEYQAAILQLDSLKARGSDSLYRETVDELKDFLKSNPSAVIDLQAQGFDFGAASRAAFSQIEETVKYVGRNNTDLLSMNLKQGKALKERSLEVQQIRSESDERQTKIRKLTIDHDTATTELAKMSKDYEASEETKRSLVTERDAAETSYNQLKRSHDEISNDLKDKEAEVLNLSEQVFDEQMTTRDALNSRQQSEQRVKDIEEKMENSKKSFERRLQQQRQSSKTRIDQLRSGSNATEQSYEQELQQVQQQATERIEALKGDLVAMKDDFEKRLLQQQQQAAERIKELQGDLIIVGQSFEQQLQQQQQLSATRIKELESDLTTSRRDHRELQQQQQQSTQRVKELEGDLIAAQQSLGQQLEQQRQQSQEQQRMRQRQQLRSAERIETLTSHLNTANERVLDLSEAIQAHVRENNDLSEELETIYFEASRLRAELMQEKSLRGDSVREVARQRAEIAALNLSNDQLSARNAELAQEVQDAAEDLIATDNRHTVQCTLWRAAFRACRLRSDSRRSRLVQADLCIRDLVRQVNESKVALTQQARELSEHRDCVSIRQSLQQQRQLVQRQATDIEQKSCSLSAYQNLILVTCLSDNDHDILQSPRFEASLRDLSALPDDEAFLTKRRQPSAIIHGLTSFSDVKDIKSQAMSMLVACYRDPCMLELRDLYSFDQKLDEATDSERTSGLLLLFAVLKVRVGRLKGHSSKPFASSIFVLHAIHLLCAWSGHKLLEFLQVKRLFEQHVRSRLDGHVLVKNFAKMIAVLLDGHNGLSFGDSLRRGNLPGTIGRGGFAYIPIAEDIVICTPTGDAVYVHNTQYSGEHPNYRDNLDPSSFRLVFEGLPLLGNFKSSWWDPDSLAHPALVLDMAMEKSAEQVELRPPSEDTLRLLVE